MSQAEIFNLIQQVQDQYAALFAQVITINFAMIVAVFYFLHRTSLRFRVAAFLFYITGMLALVGMMLHAANVKAIALGALTAIPAGERDGVVAAYLAFQDSWLARASALFQNASVWLLLGVVSYMLFLWRNPQGERA